MAHFIWHPASAERYLFHYTREENAEDLLDTGIALVGPGSNYGLGFYATDMTPDAHDRDEIHRELFLGWPRLWNAVVVIEVDIDGRPFEQEHPHHWRIPATDRVALGDRIIAIAVFDEQAGAWVYDEDLLYEP